jgi:hypothetical protein
MVSCVFLRFYYYCFLLTVTVRYSSLQEPRDSNCLDCDDYSLMCECSPCDDLGPITTIPQRAGLSTTTTKGLFTDDGAHKDGTTNLSTTTLAAILGSVGGLVLIACIALMLWRRRRTQQANSEPRKTTLTTTTLTTDDSTRARVVAVKPLSSPNTAMPEVVYSVVPPMEAPQNQYDSPFSPL